MVEDSVDNLLLKNVVRDQGLPWHEDQINV